MENQVEKKELTNENSQNNLSDIFDILSGVGLVGGAVGSFFGNAAFAAIPISFSVALQMANRRQLKVELAQIQQSSIMQMTEQLNNNKSVILGQFQQLRQYSEDSLTQQDQKFQTITNHLSGKITVNQENFNRLKVEKDELNQLTSSLESQLNVVQNVVETLQQIENTSQMIRSKPDGVEAYYQRGLNHQNLGDKTGAIEDYTEALHIDSTYAKAYHSRGVILAEMGNRKQAVEDLRLAAKYYFEQGDIESYEQARILSKEFYAVRHSSINDETVEMAVSQSEVSAEMAAEQMDLVTVGGLFDDDADSDDNISILG